MPSASRSSSTSSRFEEAFTIVRRLLAGERVTFEGRFHSVHDALLLPPPARRPKLMIGANKPRMLSIALPHVDAWNTWFTHYGNTAEGFAEHNAYVSGEAERAGRDPTEIERSACVLVEVEPGAGERRRDVPAVAAAKPCGPPARTRAGGRGRGDPRPRSDHRAVDPRARRSAPLTKSLFASV